MLRMFSPFPKRIGLPLWIMRKKGLIYSTYVTRFLLNMLHERLGLGESPARTEGSFKYWVVN